MNWVKNMELSASSTIKQDSLPLTVLITKLIGMLFFKFLKQKQPNLEGKKMSMLQKSFWNKSENGYEFLVVLLVQSLSHVWLFVTPWTAAHQASLSSTVSQSLLKFMSTELVMPSNYFILCHLFSFCLQYFPASGSFPVSHLFISSGQSIVYLQLQHQSFPWIFRVDFL